jgi:hypothetical protein
MQVDVNQPPILEKSHSTMHRIFIHMLILTRLPRKKRHHKKNGIPKIESKREGQKARIVIL